MEDQQTTEKLQNIQDQMDKFNDKLDLLFEMVSDMSKASNTQK